MSFVIHSILLHSADLYDIRPSISKNLFQNLTFHPEKPRKIYDHQKIELKEYSSRYMMYYGRCMMYYSRYVICLAVAWLHYSRCMIYCSRCMIYDSADAVAMV